MSLKGTFQYIRSMWFKTPIYQGNYETWEHALKKSYAYTDPAILEATHIATNLIKNGSVCCEQDGTVFAKPRFRNELLSCIAYVAHRCDKPLKILDIGGALGSLYFQVKAWLPKLPIEWTVLEQEHVVSFAKKNHETDLLKFISELSADVAETRFDIAIFASSLQYFSNPYVFLDNLMARKIEFFLYERTPFSSKNKSKIMLQNVNTKHYKTQYPSWILNEKKIQSEFENNFILCSEFDSHEQDIYISPHEKIYFKGALWQRQQA